MNHDAGAIHGMMFGDIGAASDHDATRLVATNLGLAVAAQSE